MKKIIIISLSLAIFSISNAFANINIEFPKENATIPSTTFFVEWICENDFEISVKDKNENNVFEENFSVTCEEKKFKQEISLKDSSLEKIKILALNNGNTEAERNIFINLGSAPNPATFIIKLDPRVKFMWEEFGKIENENSEENSTKNDKNQENNEEKAENKNLEENTKNNETQDNNEKKCKIYEEIKEIKNLDTNFSDISDSKFANDIKILENVSVVKWTSKNIFENREITKSEALWMVLKANCYDVSTKSNWQEKVVEIAFKNNFIENKNFQVNEKIKENEAFEILFKWAKIDKNEENLKKVENLKQKENSTILRDKFSNILVSFLKIFK